MRSIKPGRGPSMMGGITGIFMIGLGLLWTALAAQASALFALFGLLWTGAAIAMTVYHFKNATGKNRFSSFDITEDDEEPDPLHTRFGGSRPEPPRPDGRKRFCPYCGTEAAADFSFCQSCGRKLP